MLEPILQSTRSRVAALLPRRAALEAAAARASPPLDFAGALRTPHLSLIAEIKRRSPSAGVIAPDLDPVELSRSYARGGAAAVSVLTEPEHFGGSTDDLAVVAADGNLPVLQKDFVLDSVQIDEARSIGADAVLLIAATLSGDALADLVLRTTHLGMAALVEAHTADEVNRAVDAGAAVIGINNRDLATFNLELTTAEKLRHLIPEGVIAVAESGISTPADISRMSVAGFDAVLVGSAAARAADPARFLAGLVGTTQ